MASDPLPDKLCDHDINPRTWRIRGAGLYWPQEGHESQSENALSERNTEKFLELIRKCIAGERETGNVGGHWTAVAKDKNDVDDNWWHFDEYYRRNTKIVGDEKSWLAAATYAIYELDECDDDNGDEEEMIVSDEERMGESISASLTGMPTHGKSVVNKAYGHGVKEIYDNFKECVDNNEKISYGNSAAFCSGMETAIFKDTFKPLVPERCPIEDKVKAEPYTSNEPHPESAMHESVCYIIPYNIIYCILLYIYW